MSLRIRTALAVLATAIACTGCGFGPGAGTSAVSVRVTRSFGAAPVKTISAGKVSGTETDMQLLEHHFPVTTRYAGAYVQSIAGHAGTSSHYDWFFYVNGVQAKKGAAATDVRKGDQIWWDLHDWQATESIPAVVGSFPEPFRNGINGQRYPTTLECSSGVSGVMAACNTVSSAFAHLHIPASPQVPGTGSGPDTLSINVGTWQQLRGEVAAEYIAHGPGTSGVYARFVDNGSRLELLDPAGKVVRTLGAGSGLVAATGDPSNVPTWLVTGTDAAGVQAAARAVTAGALAGHFALAVDGSTHVPVPVQGSP